LAVDLEKSTVENLIKMAIENKRLVEFDYNGFHRVAEPHVYGLNKGVPQLLAYQTEGGSSSGRIPEWRRFDFPNISNLRITDIPFRGPRPTRERPPFDQIFFEVK
jgi:hypothetical protein